MPAGIRPRGVHLAGNFAPRRIEQRIAERVGAARFPLPDRFTNAVDSVVVKLGQQAARGLLNASVHLPRQRRMGGIIDRRTQQKCRQREGQ